MGVGVTVVAVAGRRMKSGKAVGPDSRIQDS